MFVASNAGQHNKVLLTALECVNTGDFNFTVEVLLERTAIRHVLHHKAPLALIRCDNANFTRLDTSFEKPGDDLLDVRSFGAIEVRCSGSADLFITKIRPEHHRTLSAAYRPGEVDFAADALGHGDTVLERAFVEHVGGEFGQSGMHAILYLQSDGHNSKDD